MVGKLIEKYRSIRNSKIQIINDKHVRQLADKFQATINKFQICASSEYKFFI